MNPIKNEPETGISLNRAKSIIDVIESKSLLNMVKNGGIQNFPVLHEQILFSTIAENSGSMMPEMKLLSAFGRFGPHMSEEELKIKEKSSYKREARK